MNFSNNVLQNLNVPREDAEEQQPVKSMGLLARKAKPKSQKDILSLEPRDRIGHYVAEIRKARTGLKNDGT